jgi:hypothetical protein
VTILRLARASGEAFVSAWPEHGPESDAGFWKRSCARKTLELQATCRSKEIASKFARRFYMSKLLLKQRAEAQFRKLPEAEDNSVKSATSEYEAGADLVTAKIAHLKGLRLARDAAEKAAPPPTVPVEKAGKKKKRPAVSRGLSLSDWRQSHHAGRGS